MESCFNTTNSLLEATTAISQPNFLELLANFEKSKYPLPTFLKEELIAVHDLEIRGRFLESCQRLKALGQRLDSNEQILELSKVLGGTPRPLQRKSSSNSTSSNNDDELDACYQGVCLGLLLQAICRGGCK
jgi:hypothetical protein